MYKQIVASGKLTGDEQQYAEEIGKHEAAHVQALTGAIQKLGGTPVAAQMTYNFPAFDTRDNIVKFLVTVEDLGAGAYLAAAPEMQSADLLTAAVQIHNVEGEHASIWRRQAKMPPVVGAFAVPLARADVLRAAAPILGLSGGTSATTAPVTGTTAGTPPTAPSTGSQTMIIPQTGAPEQGGHHGLRAAIIAGATAIGVGAALRAGTTARDSRRVNDS